ncbi:hypothetical protein SDRG_13503 [Saprolegnia diclina VS20]|uniref:Uncharacterized protein n=1 Tax=Saprolegnia diclina (strain VS20) TaxID=1156394 RepID=T0RGI9_SAPDV|nr:hypothetical protein SDRG_13503 [Saprolegnia diclina VS20]EQC28822.1 hypothetical protein SDRG_13503 [Saprolegnia diclina VS20]|eukprot:XP_008617817.1 hypothetical protein SDRG_13503 [Saprolegnia diclina VS20]
MGCRLSFYVRLRWLLGHKMQLLLLSLDSVGKNTSLYKLELGDVVTTRIRIGFNVESLDIPGLSCISWDVAGPIMSLRQFYSSTVHKASALVLILTPAIRRVSTKHAVS